MKLKVFSLILLAILSNSAFALTNEEAIIKCETAYESCIANCNEDDEKCAISCDDNYSKCLKDNGIEEENSVEP
jgi:hypothetical protein